MKLKIHASPKSLIYTGNHPNVPTEIIHYQFDQTETIITDSFKPENDKNHYIQVVGLNDIATIQSLKQYYAVDPLILEDIFNVNQRNKIEIKPNYIFGVIHLEYLFDDSIHSDYMSFLMFKDTLITFHESHPRYLVPLTDYFQEKCGETIDYILFLCLDIITDQHIAVYDKIENNLSEYEEQILESKSIEQESFYGTRKHLLKLKNTVYPTLEQLERALEKSVLFLPKNKGFYDDLVDHLKRLDNQINQAREMVRHLLDLQINNQSNTMNRIMTTLTLFSAIFIPLSFLTGFFGMNFVYFEILAYEHALAVFIGLCFTLSGFMVLLFKLMKWF